VAAWAGGLALIRDYVLGMCSTDLRSVQFPPARTVASWLELQFYHLGSPIAYLLPAWLACWRLCKDGAGGNRAGAFLAIFFVSGIFGGGFNALGLMTVWLSGPTLGLNG